MTGHATAKWNEKLAGVADFFNENGYAIIENFLTDAEVDAMRAECLSLIRESKKESTKQMFIHDYDIRDKYFIDSADTIRYFFEKDAFNLETGELLIPEEQSVAKIGHAVHALNDHFRAATTSGKVQDVYRALGYKEPTIMQSMIIFKNPHVGGEYTPHQDASYLCAEPATPVAGPWFALDDATANNGCLEFIPGSHKGPLLRQYVRTEEIREDGVPVMGWTAPQGKFEDSQFVAQPAKKGDCVLIHGLVVHRSAANKSDKSRWIYTFHCYDKSVSKYSDKNWLQPVAHDTFLPVFAKS